MAGTLLSEEAEKQSEFSANANSDSAPPTLGQAVGIAMRHPDLAVGVLRAVRFRRGCSLRRDGAISGLRDAGDRRIFGEPFLFHQEFERAKAPAADRSFIGPCFLARFFQNRPDVEALEEPPPRDIFCELGDRLAGLGPANIGLGEEKPVERNIARRAEADFR